MPKTTITIEDGRIEIHTLMDDYVQVNQIHSQDDTVLIVVNDKTDIIDKNMFRSILACVANNSYGAKSYERLASSLLSNWRK